VDEAGNVGVRFDRDTIIPGGYSIYLPLVLRQ